jgi:hypothetical protein
MHHLTSVQPLFILSGAGLLLMECCPFVGVSDCVMTTQLLLVCDRFLVLGKSQISFQGMVPWLHMGLAAFCSHGRKKGKNTAYHVSVLPSPRAIAEIPVDQQWKQCGLDRNAWNPQKREGSLPPTRHDPLKQSTFDALQNDDPDTCHVESP